MATGRLLPLIIAASLALAGAFTACRRGQTPNPEAVERSLLEVDREWSNAAAAKTGSGFARTTRPMPPCCLRNARAGHMLPPGDPERFILVKAELLDSRGRVVGLHVHRIGQEWIWNPSARKISDNRLQTHEARLVRLPFRYGAGARPARLRVTVENWRMSRENAAYHKLTGVYPLAAEVLRVEKMLR
jgi:hypothetical protein